MVGRSDGVTGPHLDGDGVPLVEGGGTEVTLPTERWRGPGHNAVPGVNGINFIVHHTYDAENTGVFALRVVLLIGGADGWLSVKPG